MQKQKSKENKTMMVVEKETHSRAKAAAAVQSAKTGKSISLQDFVEKALRTAIDAVLGKSKK